MGTLAGRIIKGYELVEQIGTGSFGEVYRAVQPAVGREVAVKIILPHYANHPQFIRRFEAEAQLVARVEHPFIVPLYDYWREPDGAYLIMRYLRGGSLKDIIAQNGALPLTYISQVLDQICSALTTAHRNGVVHRDIKPANILLDENQNAYLVDFGIAKDLESEAEATAAGSVVGSPAYLSPEQVQAEVVTPLSDIYSLGIVLYEMLIGEKPFPNETVSSLLIKQINDPLPNVQLKRTDLPKEIHSVIQRATAKPQKNRYPNALTFAAAFRKALEKANLENEDGTLVRASSTNIATRDPNSTTRSFDPLADSTQEISGSLDVDLPEPENPYKGLRAFQESDSADFFGRKELVNRLLNRMQENHPLNRFLAVVGPSGSGKSSVVKAGLIPALRQGALKNSDKWFFVEMVPGTYPFEELEAALLRIAINPPASLLTQLKEDKDGLRRAIKRVLPEDPETELFLLIDQFEEIFTLVDDEAKRTLFMESLIEAVQDSNSRLNIIITIRADFYDKPLYYAEFGETIRQRSEVVLPMNPEELRAAITDPAERVGLQVEDILAQEIIKDVQEQPGALPLLQYALTELYERREARRLTLNAYQEIGGISGALARRAEELYLSQTPEKQEVTRQIFLRLVSLGEGTEDTRRRILLSELLNMQKSDEVINSTLDAFGKYRLLTFDHDPLNREPTVEVAHEALIRQWTRLKDWINNLRDDLRQHAKLTSATKEWVGSKKDSSFLATGTRLTQLREWANVTDILLTEDESNYVAASIQRLEAEQKAEAERQAREEALEERSRRFLQGLVATLTIGLLVAVVLAIFAFNAQSEAERNADEAERQAQIAETNEAEAEEQRESAEANAAEAETQREIAEANAAEAETQREIAEANAAEAETQREIAETNADTAIEQQNIAQSLALVANARNAISEHSPNLALTLALEASQVLNPPLPEVERTLTQTVYGPGVRYRLEPHNGSVMDIVISNDGRLAASGAVDGTVAIWDIESRTIIHTLTGHTGAVLGLDFSDDGTMLATGSIDQNIIIWDVETGEQRLIIQGGHADDINEVIFHPDGQRLFAASGNFNSDDVDNYLRLWDVETGELIREYDHIGAVLEIDISPDGQHVVTTSGGAVDVEGEEERYAIIWDIETGEIIQQIGKFIGMPRHVTYSPDGSLLAVGNWDTENSGVVRVFDAATGEPVQLFYGHPNIITQVVFTPDGEQLISVSWDATMRIWDLRTGTEVEQYTVANDRVLSLALSPDGNIAITGLGNAGEDYIEDNFQDNGIYIWDLENSSQTAIAEGHDDWLWSVAVHPNGETFATGAGSLFEPEQDNTVRIWDVETGDELMVLDGHTHTVDSITYLADGTQLLSASWDTTVILWNTDTGEEIRRYEGGHTDYIEILALSPDESTFLTAGHDGLVVHWDVETGDIINTFVIHAPDEEDNTVDVNTVMFTPQGFITGDENGDIIEWNLETGEEIRCFAGHDAAMITLDMNSTNTMFASSSKDGTARTWDYETGNSLRQFIGHNNWVNEVIFTVDDQAIITVGADTTVRVWDIASGEEIRRYEGHTDWAVAVAITPDGTRIVSGSDDDTARVWRFARNIDELRDWAANNRYIPELSCEQRRNLQLDISNCEN